MLPSAKKSDDTTTTTTTSGNTNAPDDPTGTPATTTPPRPGQDKPVSPDKVVVKQIDPPKPEPPRLPGVRCKTDPRTRPAASYKIALLPHARRAGFRYCSSDRGGRGASKVLTTWSHSDGFTKDRAVLSDEQFVTSLYTGFLARQPDDDGKGVLARQLQAGVSRTDVAVGFVNSDGSRARQQPG